MEWVPSPRIQELGQKPFLKHSLFPGALEIVGKLKQAGFEAYLAGGCVRDVLLERNPQDFDIATSAVPSAVKSLFPKTVDIGERFGTIGVLRDGTLYQVTTFRKEGSYRDGRHPDSVTFSDAWNDAIRRDFTINGLFADPDHGRIFDYVGGLEDLRLKTIRAIGDPSERFQEDALRLFRAARFSAVLEFPIEAKTAGAVRALAPTLKRVSAERIRDELMKLLACGDPSRGVRTLDDLSLLEEILPEVSAMKGVEQPSQFHPEGDVFVHTLLVLDHLEPKEPILLIAALLHDVGKPKTFERADRIRFNNHDRVGALMARDILRRLAFSNEEVETVEALVEEHLYIADLPKMREAKRRRFLGRPDIQSHLALHRADCLGSHKKLDIYEFCQQQLALLAQKDLHPPKLLSGKDLMDLGYSPGPVFKQILGALEDEQLEGRLQTRDQALEWLQKEFPKTP